MNVTGLIVFAIIVSPMTILIFQVVMMCVNHHRYCKYSKEFEKNKITLSSIYCRMLHLANNDEIFKKKLANMKSPVIIEEDKGEKDVANRTL